MNCVSVSHDTEILAFLDSHDDHISFGFHYGLYCKETMTGKSCLVYRVSVIY